MTVQFEDLNLRPELVQAINKLGYTQPTPSRQALSPMQVVPMLLVKPKLHGKTAAFASTQRMDPSSTHRRPVVAPPRAGLQVTE